MSMAVASHAIAKEMETLRYHRELELMLAYQGKNGSAKRELSAFYRLFSLITGTEIDPDKAAALKMKQGIDNYERAVGLKIDSHELKSLIDQTVEAMTQKST